MTVEEFCEEFGISRDTLYKWRQLGTAPRAIRLPNGKLRFRRVDVDAWAESLLVAP